MKATSPSDPATLTDNSGTWLGFTDLVSHRSGLALAFAPSWDEVETKKMFYSDPSLLDVEYLSPRDLQVVGVQNDLEGFLDKSISSARGHGVWIN